MCFSFLHRPFNLLGKGRKFHFLKLKPPDLGDINNGDFIAVPLFIVGHGFDYLVGRKGQTGGKSKL